MRIVVLCMSLFLLSQISTSFVHAEDVIKIGIIGLDSSHATEFTKMINAEKQDEEFKGFRVVAAYPQGSKDIPTSMEKVPSYIESVKANGVEIVDSIPELIKRVDVVLVETNDGKPHLEQVTPVLKAGKPVFVDKPVAGTLADVLEVYKLAEEYKTPIFSSSSLRYTNGLKALKKEDVTSCYTFSPCPLEKSHPDFYWYGIHGVEMLYTVMETGCVSVSRSSTTTNDIATGVWKDAEWEPITEDGHQMENISAVMVELL